VTLWSDEQAVRYMLELLHPKLLKLLKLKDAVKYIDAVNELATSAEDKALLSPQLLEVVLALPPSLPPSFPVSPSVSPFRICPLARACFAYES